MMSLSTPVAIPPQITWEKLPEEFVLPDEPVENLEHPLLAAVLREILEIGGLIPSTALIASNLGICATVNDKIVVKAPDWVYVNAVEPTVETRRSYTPNLEGEVPVIVMEFLSDNDGGEYSMYGKYPYGKWWFYERILQVPVYVIFVPGTGELEVYRLKEGQYQPELAPEDNLYWVEQIQLYLGVWLGTKFNRTGYWLRWWDAQGNLLPWGTEKIDMERREKEKERREKELALEKAQRLAAKLKELGIDPESLES